MHLPYKQFIHRKWFCYHIGCLRSIHRIRHHCYSTTYLSPIHRIILQCKRLRFTHSYHKCSFAKCKIFIININRCNTQCQITHISQYKILSISTTNRDITKINIFCFNLQFWSRNSYITTYNFCINNRTSCTTKHNIWLQSIYCRFLFQLQIERTQQTITTNNWLQRQIVDIYTQLLIYLSRRYSMTI